MTTPNRYLIVDLDLDKHDQTKVLGLYCVIYDARFNEVSRLSCDFGTDTLPGLVRWLERHDLPVFLGTLALALDLDQLLWDTVGASFVELVDDNILDVALLADLVSATFEPYDSNFASFGRCNHVAQLAKEVIKRLAGKGYN